MAGQEEILHEVIDELCFDEFHDEQGKILLDRLDSYYNKIPRHSYSVITEKLYSIEDEKILFLKMNFEKFIMYVSNEIPKYENKTKIFKFLDHVSLELNRLDLHNQQKIEQQTFIENVKLMLSRDMHQETDRIMNEIKIKIEDDLTVKVHSAEEKININLISVLGIFAAFITAFIGGIGAFSSIMQYLHQASIYRLVFTICLFGLIYFDVCYALIYAVSRMTKKKITSSNVKESDQQIKKFSLYIADRIKRYPLFFGFNSIMILGIIVITFMYFNQSTTESLLGVIDRLRS